MIFVNYSVIDHALLNKIICDLRKLKRAHPIKSGHFAPACLGGSNKLRTSQEVSDHIRYASHSLYLAKLLLSTSLNSIKIAGFEENTRVINMIQNFHIQRAFKSFCKND